MTLNRIRKKSTAPVERYAKDLWDELPDEVQS